MKLEAADFFPKRFLLLNKVHVVMQARHQAVRAISFRSRFRLINAVLFGVLTHFIVQKWPESIKMLELDIVC